MLQEYMCVLDRTVTHSTDCQRCRMPVDDDDDDLSHILSTGVLWPQAATQGLCMPKPRVLAATYNLYLVYSYMATLKICISYIINTHLPQNCLLIWETHSPLVTGRGIPLGGYQSFYTDELLPVGHNYGKGIYEKSLFRLMLGQYPQTGYEYLHFFAFHLSAASCHLMPYKKPRNNVTWASGRRTCISSLNHADIIASVSYRSCAPTSVHLNEAHNLSFLCGWTATTHYCWTATS
jgi:hypothetical protein